MDTLSSGQYVTINTLPPDHYVIYTLIDPTDELVYYVGQTCRPQVRLATHLSDRYHEGKKGDWLRRLEQKGQQPLMQILEVVIGQKTALKKEQEWILHFLAQKMPLLNYQWRPGQQPVRRPRVSDLTAEADRVPEENISFKIFSENSWDKVFSSMFKQKNTASSLEAYPGGKAQVREMLSVIAENIKELQILEARCKEMEARYEEMRREFCTKQQELYKQPLVFDTDAEMPTIAGLEASWAEDGSLKAPVDSVRLAQWTRFIHGTPTSDTLAALAAHFQVEDFSYLSEGDWPAVLEWFADLIVG